VLYSNMMRSHHRDELQQMPLSNQTKVLAQQWQMMTQEDKQVSAAPARRRCRRRGAR
jgi:hypothetical protein